MVSEVTTVIPLHLFQRLDGRGAYDFRNIKVTFGVDRGCSDVQLGETR